MIQAQEKFAACIAACQTCAIRCSHCATACIQEPALNQLQRCIQLDLECALLCRSAAEMMGLGGEYSYQLCALCAEMCNACAEECEKHSTMGHCRDCAAACRDCAAACEQMAAAV